MTWQKVGLNLSGLQDIALPNITVPLTPPALLESMQAQAVATGLWFEIVVLTAIFLILVWTFSENSPFSTFKYNYLRATNLALAITSMLGISLVLSGFADSYRIVAIYLLLDVITFIGVVAVQSKE